MKRFFRIRLHLYNSIMGLLMFLCTVSCYNEVPFVPGLDTNEPSLYINHQQVVVDTIAGIALIPVEQFGHFEGIISYGGFNATSINGAQVKNGMKFIFGVIDAQSKFKVEVLSTDSLTQTYQLMFTLLPVIHIEHEQLSIPNDEEVIVNFTMVQPGWHDTFANYSIMKTRGFSSLVYPKKSYGLQFLSDFEAHSKKNISLLGMNKDDDWILDAAYIDQSIMRNRISFDIWGDMQTDGLLNGKQFLPSATKGAFIELFINNSYIGLYCLNERLDPKSTGLSKLPDNKQPYLYKSEKWSPATTYSGLPDTAQAIKNWSGWEQKYPKPELTPIWKPLYDFVRFVFLADDTDFTDSIAHYLHIDQAIDYYLFINLIQGEDNAGKNLFLAKTDTDQPFYIIPWDLDATWGRNWLGDPYTVEDVTFNLYRRIMATNPDDFNQKLSRRWFQLRASLFNPENLTGYFTSYSSMLIESGAEMRESEKWPASLSSLTYEVNYISEWTVNRIKQLDQFFDGLN
jgi:spore coat protein H